MFKLPEQALSPEDYLVFEAQSETRHEYIGGTLHAMAGGTIRHNRISLNIAAYFLSIAPEACRVYQEGMKLRVAENVFYYPDVMVVCHKPEQNPYFETEPCILVEVLSQSTKDIDLREKMLSYKSLPSAELYLIVDTERLAVRQYWRDGEGKWQLQEHAGDGDIALPCLSGVLSLPQIYRNVF
ncbi:MAG: Uma2 family endonuclease [Trueperaceae bacterium]|nr:Uma2 family endonuclease [Trueperaceae bacterium]